MVRLSLAGCLGLLAVPDAASAFRPPPGKLVRFPAGRLSVYCPVYHGGPEPAPTNCSHLPGWFMEERPQTRALPASAANGAQVLDDAFAALAALQNSYFDATDGTWPSSIDWTGAVVETVLSGMLTTLTKSLGAGEDRWKQRDKLVTNLFGQLVHSFFGQDALAIKGQAYDDMLWVVLGWIEAIKFVRLHGDLHYAGTEHSCKLVPDNLDRALRTLPWQGYDYLCAFADRARAFWDLASAGWGTHLCHGGMVWNPRLEPYKNAITNELWVAASISIYENFPHDKFRTSWATGKGFPTKDTVYLAAAVEGYKWLQGVNMTNSQGLYVDGYHIDGSKKGNVECDVRDETVYTYNQGVMLTGQRGLWAVTGSPSYLQDGHELIRAVIKATGWDLLRNAPVDNLTRLPPGELPPWRGLGRGGILEEKCDASGTCSQDAQTFKGIYFHHLTAFCAPVEPVDGASVNTKAFGRVRAAHDETCGVYRGWVQHNVEAALATRDQQGRFGMWWGAGLFPGVAASEADDGVDHASVNNTDYRNRGTPQDALWGATTRWMPGAQGSTPAGHDRLPQPDRDHRLPDETDRMSRRGVAQGADDPNRRGRGRTVETQAGGLALLRAYFELCQGQQPAAA